MKEARSFVFPLVGGCGGEFLRTFQVFLAEEREVVQYRVARPTIKTSQRIKWEEQGKDVTETVINMNECQYILHHRPKTIK